VLGFGFGLKARKKLCSTSTVGADSLGHDPNIVAGSLSIHEKKGSTIVRGERGRPVLLFLEAEFREPELGGNRADEHNCLSGNIQASTSGARCPAGGGRRWTQRQTGGPLSGTIQESTPGARCLEGGRVD
jgi:hypothetical protein